VLLSDATWISRIADPAASRRLRGKGLRGKDIPGIEVRIIEYTVVGDPDHPLGAGEESEPFCLATTLIDEHAYLVGGFPDLYTTGGNWRPRSATWRPGCAAALTSCRCFMAARGI
jgi:hypothetical protein